MRNKNIGVNYILYCRKSSEAEDRQVLSIDSQVEELTALAQSLGLRIVDTIKESRSAKNTGRDGFDFLIKKITTKKADGILCWKLDRLARNMIDGGTVIDMLQRGEIKSIQTYDKEYLPDDNVLLMSVEFGMANQFVRDLSNNVKRGFRKKLKEGWKPGLAPIGYLNDKIGNTIIKDEIGFPLIKMAFKTMLAGVYTPIEVLDKLNNDWGYRTPKHKKLGGKPLAKSNFYKMLSNTFYCGRFEFPAGSGNWYKGKHERMMSESEFDKIQSILGRKNYGRPNTNRVVLDLYGFFKCGVCGCAITPDRKVQTICTKCWIKFSSKNKDYCPKCNTKISRMKKPTQLNYTYYRCTSKKKPDCSKASIESGGLNKMVIDILEKLTISESMKDWYIRRLNDINKIEKRNNRDTVIALQEAYADCQRRIDNLLNMKIQPQNYDGSILSDEQFSEKNNKLIREREKIKEKMNDLDASNDRWTNDAIKTYKFACHAKHQFENGSIEDKKKILKGLGSNLEIYNKKLLILLPKHLELIKDSLDHLKAIKPNLEPKNFRLDYRKTGLLEPVFSSMHGWSYKIRTFFMLNKEYFYIPDLNEISSK